MTDFGLKNCVRQYIWTLFLVIAILALGVIFYFVAKGIRTDEASVLTCESNLTLDIYEMTPTQKFKNPLYLVRACILHACFKKTKLGL